MELLKYEINPLLEGMMPKPNDWDSWVAFETIYEIALHKMREIITHIKTRNPDRIYWRRRLIPKLLQAREQEDESLEKIQSVRN
jgi:hypothetical protein